MERVEQAALAVGLLLSLLAVQGLSQVSSDLATLYVAPNGTDSGFCDSEAQPCASLSFVVKIAASVTPSLDFLPIRIAPGEYGPSSCNLTIGRPLIITGAGKRETTISCEDASPFLSTTAPISLSELSITRAVLDLPGHGIIDIADLQSGAAVSVISVSVFNVSGTALSIATNASSESIADLIISLIDTEIESDGGAIAIYMRAQGNVSRVSVLSEGNVLSALSNDALSGLSVQVSGQALDNVNFSITETQFLGFMGESGGAGLSLSVTGSIGVFETHFSLVSCVVSGNSAGSGSGGGALLLVASDTGDIENTTVLIDDCLFSRNKARLQGGGLAVSIGDKSSCIFANVTIRGSSFVGNECGSSGGGLHVTIGGSGSASDSMLYLVNSSFVDNTAVSGVGGGGAAISTGLTDSKTMAIAHNCNFTGNTVSSGGGGGGLYVDLGASADEMHCLVSNCTFLNNIGGQGGGLTVSVGSLQASAVQLVDCMFTKNSARDGGGAVSASAVNMGSIVRAAFTLSGCVLTDNAARLAGGGIFLGFSIADENMSRIDVIMVDTVIVGNTAGAYGGAGAFFSFAAVMAEERQGTPSPPVVFLSVSDCTWADNSASTGSGGGLLIDLTQAPRSEINISTSTFNNNSALGGNGGGALFATSLDDPVNLMYCESDSDDADLTVPYRVWQPIVRITVSDSLFVSNVASCSTCSGGGIAVQSGGVLSLIRTTVWNNTAGFFGGGLFLGGTSSGFSSCTLFTDGSGIGGNSALRGGAQLANSCGGNVTWSNTTVALANTTNEVFIPFAGNVTATSGTVFVCPRASKFIDLYLGLFGPNGSYPSSFGPPWDTVATSGPFIGRSCPYNASSLQFGSMLCPQGTYSLLSGNSTGSPGESNALQCLPCPYGGVCVDGILSAAPGYWGGGFPNVSFILCPSGYCCANQGQSPCDQSTNCAGHRFGPICGSCMPGFVQSFGSSACIPSSSCSRSRVALFWMAFCASCILSAFILLGVSSDVFRPDRSTLDCKIKVTVYFYQMVGYVQLEDMGSKTTLFADVISSVLGLHLPRGSGASLGFCVSPSLTSMEKLLLQIAFPVGVAVAACGIMACFLSDCCGCRKCMRRDHASVPGVRHSIGESVPLLRTDSAELRRLRVVHPFSVSAKSLEASLDVIPIPARVVSTAASLTLMLYSSFIATVLTALHCVRVPGVESLRLLVDGSLLCSTTAPVASVGLFALLLFTFTLFPITRWASRTHSSSLCAEAEPGWKLYAKLGIQRGVTSMYNDGVNWWECVLLGHRLALALLFTFAQAFPVLQTVSYVLVCNSFLALHLYIEPMKDGSSHRLQGVLLLCLGAVTACRCLSSSRLELAVYADDPLVDAILFWTSLLFIYCIPLLALAFAYKRSIVKLLGLLRQRTCQNRQSSGSVYPYTALAR